MLNKLIRLLTLTPTGPSPALRDSGLMLLPFSGLILLVDQVSKFFASLSFTYAVPYKVNAYLDILLLHNTGAAFSFLSDAGGWQRWFLSLIAFIVSAILITLLRQHAWQKHKWYVCSMALILSGAIGNVADRIIFGYVVDFISFHYNDWYWPSFNVADVAISIGASMFIADAFMNRNRPSTENSHS